MQVACWRPGDRPTKAGEHVTETRASRFTIAVSTPSTSSRSAVSSASPAWGVSVLVPGWIIAPYRRAAATLTCSSTPAGTFAVPGSQDRLVTCSRPSRAPTTRP